MKRPDAPDRELVRDKTRHEIIRVNLLRNTSRVVATVVGARKADQTLATYKKGLSPAQIGRGDSYVMKSRSALGSARRMVGNRLSP